MTIRNISSRFDITDKVVLITGATGGLGYAAALGLAEVGANVMLTGRNGDKRASITTDLVQKGWSAAYVVGRPDNADDVRYVVKSTVERFGGIDVLITAAGLNHVHPITDFPLEEWEEVMDVNVKGTWLTCEEGMVTITHPIMKRLLPGCLRTFENLCCFRSISLTTERSVKYALN